MSKYVRIVEKTAVEIFTPQNGFTVTDCFHADIAEQFLPCPDAVTVGSTVDSNGKWVIASAPVMSAAPEQTLPLLTPMTLYMAFTPAERIAIKTSNDATVKEFWEMYQLSAQLDNPTDPNLVSVQETLAYLARSSNDTPPGPGIIAPSRISQILAGIPQ